MENCRCIGVVFHGSSGRATAEDGTTWVVLDGLWEAPYSPYDLCETHSPRECLLQVIPRIYMSMFAFLSV